MKNFIVYWSVVLVLFVALICLCAQDHPGRQAGSDPGF